MTESVEAARYLFYGSFIDAEDNWSSDRYEKRLQVSGDLGDRLRAGFEEVLAQHDRALVIGSDCAAITPQIIERAIRELDTHDAVIGPVTDGGYYLLGLKNPLPDVFSSINWSTETVFAETATALIRHGLTFATLSVLTDIDHESDWEESGLSLDG